MINENILPDLATALEEFDEEVRFMEAKTIESSMLDTVTDKLLANPKQVLEDENLCKATRTSNIVLRREKSPLLDIVASNPLPPERRASTASLQSLPKSPLVLMKKPILPIISKYRWQNGFRKSKAGQYRKVPLLKIELEFSAELEFLPPTLEFSLYPNNNNNNGISEPAIISKHIKMSRNRFLCEMAASECNEEMLKILDQTFVGDFMVCVKESSGSSGSTSCILPDFCVFVENQLQKSPSCNDINGANHVPNDNNWIDTDPVLTVNNFKKIITC